jgi:SAM-dependent methyltransferase
VSLGADRRDWQDLAALDPYWAVLADQRHKFGGWDLDEFLASGADEAARLLAFADRLGHPREHRAALDFGCGAGRMTRALAAHFGRSVGVDIAERMVDEARRVNADVANAEFRVGGPDLAGFADGEFDLVYSGLVLQHVSSRRAVLRYMAELGRVLAAGGLLAVQVPSSIPPVKRLQPRRRLYRALRAARLPEGLLFRRLRLDPMGMWSVPEAEVVPVLERAGTSILTIERERWEDGTRSTTYFATRPPSPAVTT